jgi:putative selenium metabolism hydrolase
MDTERLIQFARALVQRPSPSGEEQAVAQRVEEEMRSLGFDEVYVDENGSVVGIVNGAHSGKTILFDAHTDTVGISPGVPWARDPFCADIVDGAIYGRGSADMKGALAAMVHAAAAVDRTALQGRIVISASTMEEVLEGLALKAVMDRTRPDFVVIGESTNLELARGGRGRAEVHLTTIGTPSHSSAPQLGRNAVLDMMRVIQAVEAIGLPEHPLMGPAILALTDIISDPYPGHSVIPSICRVTYDRRLLPGETHQDVLGAITELPELQDITLEAIIAQGEYKAYTGTRLTCEKFFPAWIYDEDDWFVRRALQGMESAALAPATRAYRFCTNAAYSAGIAGVPTVGLGPARESDAHRINERLQLDELAAVAKAYVGIIEAVLVGDAC